MIKLESDLRLEALLYSFNIEDYEVHLGELINSGYLNDTELKILEKYRFLVKSIGKIPTKSLLKSEFPELYFDNVKKVEEADINEYISLFLTRRINDKNSLKLLNISEKIRTDGLSAEVLDEIANLSNLDNIKSTFTDITKNIQDRYQSKDLAQGFPTGVEEIDKITGGLHLGTVNTIMGYAGSGKTTWGVNIAYNAIMQGFNIIYLSLEVSKEHILYDLLSRHSNESKFKMKLEHRDLKHRKLEKDKEEYLWSTIYPSFLETPGKMYIVDETDLENYSTLTLENKFKELDKLAKDETGNGISMVFIDHAQLLKFDSSVNNMNDNSAINSYISFFRKQAVNFIKEKRPACFVVLSQTNRDGWRYASKHEGAYQLNALADANELERASTLVLSIYTNEAFMQSKQAKVMVVKSRDGALMEEPVSTFIDPATYIIGDFVGGVAEEVSSFGMADIFGVEPDNSDLEQFNNKIGEPIWDD